MCCFFKTEPYEDSIALSITKTFNSCFTKPTRAPTYPLIPHTFFKYNHSLGPTNGSVSIPCCAVLTLYVLNI